MQISQDAYKAHIVGARGALAKSLGDPKIAELVTKARAVPAEQWSPEHPVIKAAVRQMIKAGMLKAGVTTGTGYNFYDLRGPAYLLFPVNTPFIESIRKKGRVNDGVGTAAHWKATRNPNTTNVYAGVSEGQRNSISTPNEIDYLSTYKEIGMERGVSFTADFAGEGYTDNLADEHLRGLFSLRLQEEMMTLLGNSGTAAGNNGFALGTPATPTLALKAGLGLTTGTYISVAVVALTGMGLNHGGQGGYGATPTVAGGLTPSYTRTNADGTTTAVNGGTSAISAMSAVLQTTAGNDQVVATVAAIKGACGYAWFVDSTDNVTGSLANAKLAAITPGPTYTIAALPAGTQVGSAAGLNTDSSFQATDFDGLLTYAFTQGLWTDMAGGGFTSLNNGQVSELETDLESIWVNYQANVQTIWCSADVKRQLQAAIIAAAGSGAVPAYRFGYDRDSQNNLTGGFVVSGYLSAYSMNPNGSEVIPIRVHPALPPGTLYYDVSTNPYPHSRIPAVREFLTQRDYYSIEWPVVTRQWTFGTYIHEVLAHYAPWITGVRTGIGTGT